MRAPKHCSVRFDSHGRSVCFVVQLLDCNGRTRNFFQEDRNSRAFVCIKIETLFLLEQQNVLQVVSKILRLLLLLRSPQGFGFTSHLKSLDRKIVEMLCQDLVSTAHRPHVFAH